MSYANSFVVVVVIFVHLSLQRNIYCGERRHPNFIYEFYRNMHSGGHTRFVRAVDRRLSVSWLRSTIVRFIVVNKLVQTTMKITISIRRTSSVYQSCHELWASPIHWLIHDFMAENKWSRDVGAPFNGNAFHKKTPWKSSMLNWNEFIWITCRWTKQFIASSCYRHIESPHGSYCDSTMHQLSSKTIMQLRTGCLWIANRKYNLFASRIVWCPRIHVLLLFNKLRTVSFASNDSIDSIDSNGCETQIICDSNRINIDGNGCDDKDRRVCVCRC